MPSQTDLDMGGTVREWVKTYLGPSVGWVYVPVKSFLASNTNTTTITAAGTYTLDYATTFVQVAVAGAVTLLLPSTILGSLAVTQTPAHTRAKVTIVDVGGFAAANPITIKPASVAETIIGLTQIQITVNYGGYTLEPSPRIPGWTNPQ
jgi:hypothetical protein